MIGVDASGLLSQAFEIARECGDQTSKRRISTLRAKTLALAGDLEAAVSDIEDGAGYPGHDAQLLAGHYAALAAIHQTKGSASLARCNLQRAVRIAASMGNRALSSDLQKGLDAASDVGATATETRRADDLDGAVALLELSAHPHIMGREAFALIQNTGCVDHLALITTNGTSRRVIATHGWSDAEALAAIKVARPDDLMDVGVHSNETWQLLARPKAAVDDRCTFAAIRKLVATAVALAQYRRDEKQRAALWPTESLADDPESIWASEQAADLLTIARRIANAPLPVLLTGETGTGKEMLARVIHRASNRADRTMVPFNCSAVPRDMVESQLFGYRRGAFTGADSSFPGVIRAAAGGTLFLDEIADVPIDVQPKLLRFLEHQEIHPLGEAQPIKVDVRIIAATNGNLDQLVAQGRFREDLYLPPQRRAPQASSPARAPGRDSHAAAALHPALRRRAEEGTSHDQRRNARVPPALLLAGEHPAAGQRGPTDGRARGNGRDADPGALVHRDPGDTSNDSRLDGRRAGDQARPRPAAADGGRTARADARPPRPRTDARPGRRSSQTAGNLAEGPVPEAPALGLPTGVVINRGTSSPDPIAVTTNYGPRYASAHTPEKSKKAHFTFPFTMRPSRTSGVMRLALP